MQWNKFRVEANLKTDISFCRIMEMKFPSETLKYRNYKYYYGNLFQNNEFAYRHLKTYI